MSAAVGVILAAVAALYVAVMISDRTRARRRRLDADGGPAVEGGRDEHGQADEHAARVPVEGCPWHPCARCAGTVPISAPAPLAVLPARPRADVAELPARRTGRRPRRDAA